MCETPTPDRYLTAAELADHDLTLADVHRLGSWAVEYLVLDGLPCWLREDLAPLVGGADGENRT
jgi:hypothetical protein